MNFRFLVSHLWNLIAILHERQPKFEKISIRYLWSLVCNATRQILFSDVLKQKVWLMLKDVGASRNWKIWSVWSVHSLLSLSMRLSIPNFNSVSRNTPSCQNCSSFVSQYRKSEGHLVAFDILVSLCEQYDRNCFFTPQIPSN